VYAREIDGQEYSFGVSGKLIMNVLVMYDRETDSLWSQLLGQAVDGPLRGTTLEFVESLQTTWAEWKALHPDTLALQKDYRGSGDSYADYYARGSAGVLGESRSDDRLYIKEFVVGVAIDDVAIAYPFSRLNEEPVVNDEVNGEALLVVFDPDSATAAVFRRELEGRTLSFQLATPGGLTEARLVDKETGTTWTAFTGEASDGPLAGAQLERIKSTSSFWFGWKDWYPDTEVYGLES
jgi:hypothetical protein